MSNINAQDFFRADELPEDSSLSGVELKRVFWHFKEMQKESQRQQVFWKSVNDSMADAYKKLAAFQDQLRASQEQLREANERLEQKVAERTAALDEAREIAENIVASVSDSLIIIDRNGAVVRVNPATLGLLGVEEGELVGRPIDAIVACDSEYEPALPSGWLAEVIERGEIRNLEASYQTKSGSRVPVIFSAAKVRGSHDERFAIVCVAKDVAERRRSEHELRRRVEQIKAQEETIRALFTPIIQVWRKVLALPIVGGLDSARVEEMTHNLLRAVVETRSHFVILDLTGVKAVDAATADHLLRINKAAGLLGTRCLLSGLSGAVARSLTTLEMDLRDLTSFRSLEAALHYALLQMGELPRARAV